MEYYFKSALVHFLPFPLAVMKLFVVLGLLSSVLGVVAGPTLKKRATVNEVPTVGYAAKAG